MLNDIIKRQKQDVALLKEQLSFEKLGENLKKSERNFLANLLKTETSYIFECKFKSPSIGVLKEDYSITHLAKTYAEYANAISVLTNQPYFDGSFEHLALVKQTVSLPVLCKDIIVDSYQIAQARYYGADAVLLMLSVLNDKSYLDCSTLAHALDMTVLTEVYSEVELERAKSLGANVIVVNHRNLHTMSLDMNRIEKLQNKFPTDAYIIAASGLQSYQDIQPLLGKVNGFLIGSSLMRSNNLVATIHDLIYGPIKVCGLTTHEDVKLAYSHGATYGGFIFAQNSKRKITLEQALKLVQTPLRYVGVFANQAIEQIVTIAQTLNLSAVQLHGQETAEYTTTLRKLLPQECQIWQAFDGNQTVGQQMPAHVDRLLVDNKKAEKFGGTGQTFDWQGLKKHPLLSKIMISGGINAHNILAAKEYGAWGIDVNSGIEQAPGIKDKAKLIHFFNTIKQGKNNANT